MGKPRSYFFEDQLAPLVALAAAASVTRTLRVGTLVLDNDYRHPAILAFSYYVVPDRLLDAFSPVVARLIGR